MNVVVDAFLFGARGNILTRFLQLHKPYTPIRCTTRLTGRIIHTRHQYDEILLHFLKSGVRKYPSCRGFPPSHYHWFQTTAQNDYRFRRRGVMDPKHSTDHTGTVRHRKSSPRTHHAAEKSSTHSAERSPTDGGADSEAHSPGSEPREDAPDRSGSCRTEHKDELAVFVGNLRTDTPDDELKESIVAVIDVTGIKVTTDQVVLIHKAYTVHAFIYLSSMDEKTWVLKGLGSLLDMSTIGQPGKKVKVRSKSFSAAHYRRPEHSSMQMSSLSERPSMETDSSVAFVQSIIATGNPATDDGGPANAMQAIGEDHSSDSDVANEDEVQIYPQTATVLTMPPSDEGGQEEKPGQVEPAPIAVTSSSPLEPITTETATSRRSDVSLHDVAPFVAPSVRCFNHNCTEIQTQTSRESAHLSKVEPAPIAVTSSSPLEPITTETATSRRSDVSLHDVAPFVAPSVRCFNHNCTEIQTQTSRESAHLSKTCMKFYLIGENLGNESRHIEFKAGQGSYLQKQLKDHVSKYMVAFLNSEGGTLLIGVSDGGEVMGIHCTQRIEDLLRQKMDATIKEIAPQVFPHTYTIDFIPVRDIADVAIENRKILEISVQPSNSSILYQTHQGHVFMRRDGSVQGPLKANDIQEWTRLMMRKEFEQREAALEAMQLNERHREVDKQRRMTVALTHELRTQRHSARQLKKQLESIDPKHYKHVAGNDARPSDGLNHLKDLSEDSETDDKIDKAIVLKPKQRRKSTLTSEDSLATNDEAAVSNTSSAPKPRRESIFSRMSAAVNPHRAIPLESNPPAVKSAPPRVNSVPPPAKTRVSVGHKEGVKIPQGTAVVPRRRSTIKPNERLSLPVEPHESRSRTCTIM